jgi:formylglycine-generating enzyme required for sulfatase activity
MMGGLREDFGPVSFAPERPQHRVRLTKGFFMAATEVTQAQWKAVMGTEPWRWWHAGKSSDAPASRLSWNDAREFCRKLSSKVGKHVRLPTEAEWEYACRAGSTTAYCFGDDVGKLGEYAWYWANAAEVGEEYPHRVAQKKPNAWGLYDMHGNVCEWCEDWYGEDYYKNSPAADPKGPATGYERVQRGGSWCDVRVSCRSAARVKRPPTYMYPEFGFRVVCAIE